MNGPASAGTVPGMNHLTIVAVITAAAGREAFVREQMEGLIAPTRAEEGCLLYDLHVDNDDPRRLLFYETWTSRELWQAHMNSAHIAAYKKATEGAVAEAAIHEMTKVA